MPIANYITYLLLLITATVNAEPLPTNHPITPLYAEFSTIECRSSCSVDVEQSWWMNRDGLKLAIGRMSDNMRELWTKHDQGLEYQYVIPDQKKIINYYTADLSILKMPSQQSQWEVLNQLISTAQLSSLVKTPAYSRYDRYQVDHYQGLLNGIQTKVLWIPDLSIPLEIQYQYPSHSVKIVLNQHQIGTSFMHQLNDQIQQYQQIDYADIGDMEHDPKQTQWLSGIKAPGLHHHVHP